MTADLEIPAAASQAILGRALAAANSHELACEMPIRYRASPGRPV